MLCLVSPEVGILQSVFWSLRDTNFDGDTIFVYHIVCPLNPFIVEGTKYSASPKRSKIDTELDGDTQLHVTPEIIGHKAVTKAWAFTGRKLLLLSQ